MSQKLSISFYAAKKLLLELLTNNKLLEDKEIKNRLREIMVQKDIGADKPFVQTPIVIDEQCKLFFPEYSNEEVRMSYLPKAVYIFFLLHPNGVEFRNMDSYLTELYQIYQIVSEEKNIEAQKIKKSLNNLVEPGNNRIYEICSIVRKALSQVLPEKLVEQYAITGKWGDLHQVNIQQSLIKIEHKKLRLIKIE